MEGTDVESENRIVGGKDLGEDAGLRVSEIAIGYLVGVICGNQILIRRISSEMLLRNVVATVWVTDSFIPCILSVPYKLINHATIPK